MLQRTVKWLARHPGRIAWVLIGAAVVGLGLWGFLHLEPKTPSTDLSWPDAAYRTMRLFTLNLDIPQDAHGPWPLWVAAFVAPLVTARGVAALFKDQLAGVVTRYFTRPDMVVFGANDRTAALIAAEPSRRWRAPIVVVDPDPVALARIAQPRLRKVLGDGANPDSLARAAARHTSTVVVCTGDHLRNSTITTQVLALPARHSRDVFVEVDGYGLASVLEQGGRRGTKPTPFSAQALAVEAVFDQLESERAAVGEPSLLGPRPHRKPATVVLFGTGALVDAALLELYRRRRLQLVEDGGAQAVVPRIVVFGPDARQRRESLEALLGTELQVVEVDAIEARLGQLVELDIGTARHLARYGCRQVIVLVPSDLDGGIAVALARHLGGAGEVIVINESPTTPIGDEIRRQSADSPLMSRVRLFRVPDRAYTLSALRGERRADRLARALAASGRPRDERTAAAREMIARAEAENVVVRRDALAGIDVPHLDLLETLGLKPARAFARARLAVDIQNPDVIERAARKMLTARSVHAFATWCEVARLRDRPEALVNGPDETAPGDPTDVRDVLQLRRTALEAAQSAAEHPATALPPVIMLCAGRGDDARAEFLRVTWQYPPPGFTAWTTAAPESELVRAASAEGVALRHPSGPDGRSPRRLALDIWKTILADGFDPAAVRVLVLPGAHTDEILIARALGATVGRVETAATAVLARVVLAGGADIVPLPDDRMTVRAFLRKGWRPPAMGDIESIARELHICYVQRQRERNVTAGPALEPWESLLPWLRESNRAVVRDVPNKLAAVGLRLAPPGRPGIDIAQAVADDMLLLAEQEHGRFTEERLTDGWTSGVRDPGRFMSPHLKPWTALDEEARDDDRGVLEDLFHALANKGIGAVPWY